MSRSLFRLKSCLFIVLWRYSDPLATYVLNKASFMPSLKPTISQILAVCCKELSMKLIFDLILFGKCANNKYFPELCHAFTTFLNLFEDNF